MTCRSTAHPMRSSMALATIRVPSSSQAGESRPRHPRAPGSSRAGGAHVDVELLHGGDPGGIVQLLQADHPGERRRQTARGRRSAAAGITPPTLPNRRNPFWSTWVTTMPISSMCAASMIRRPPLAARPMDDEVSHGIHARLRAAGELALDELAHRRLVARRAEALGEAPDQLFHALLLMRARTRGSRCRASRARAAVFSKSARSMIAAGEWM